MHLKMSSVTWRPFYLGINLLTQFIDYVLHFQWYQVNVIRHPECFCRSYKHFNECDFTNDIASAPFHLAYIFDDVDDTAWFHASLIKDIIDSHAPVETNIMRKKVCAFHEFEITESSI